MPQDATFMGAKELFAKEWNIFDFAFVRVT
jgi:hypothetical protein